MSDRAKLQGTAARDAFWVDILPAPFLADLLPSIIALLDEVLDETDQRYSWSVVRGHLHACHVILTDSQISVRPSIAPTKFHAAFSRPRQRIYMSATLGTAGELERLWGRRRIRRLPAPEGWDRQGVGRRLFFFPSRTFDDEDTRALVKTLTSHVDRALFLAPTLSGADELAKDVGGAHGGEVFTARDLEQSKAKFTQSTRASAFFANRYDGVDLVGEECRFLVVHGLPRAMNSYESLVATRFGASVFLTDRFLTRIIQAVGRCTRSATDYSAVVVVGEDITKFLLKGENRSLLHPEIQGEVEFGFEQSKDVSVQDFVENLKALLQRTPEWEEAEAEILACRDEAVQTPLPADEALRRAANHEVAFQEFLWQGDFAKALDEARQVLGQIGGDTLKGYRALWYYFAGSCASAAAQADPSLRSVAEDYFSRAGSTLPSIRWLAALRGTQASQPAEHDPVLAAQILGMEACFDKLGTVNATKFERMAAQIHTGLAASSAKQYEPALVQLGELLGFDAGNSNDDAAPDPWWRLDDRHCFVFEAHTDKLHGGNAVLGANKVKQAKGHPDWIRANLPVRDDACITTILVTPCQSMTRGATPHVDGVSYWEMEDFADWAGRAVSLIRVLWGTYPSAGDLAWRESAMSRLQQARLDVGALDCDVRARTLAGLPVSGED